MVGLVAALASSAWAQRRIEVSLSTTLPEFVLNEARADGLSGRLVVFVVRDGSRIGRDQRCVDGPFWDDPQPLFAIDVAGLRPGTSVAIDARASSFPHTLDDLPPGTYRAGARLDRFRLDGDWSRERGNLYADDVSFEVLREPSGKPLPIVLDRAIDPEAPAPARGVEWFEVRSALLSAFHGREVTLRAGVVTPLDFSRERARRYAAVYAIPGFGGDHRAAAGHAYRVARADGEIRELHANAFWIVLDPSGPNGHTLFADSANNGPCARALVEELIPALEARFPLAPRAEARILTGHSSGGWSALWLAITRPDTFGRCWSSAPDPVDFRRFQLVNIYDDASMFSRDGADVPSYRRRGRVLMTVRQEAGAENVIGPRQSSGQQWHSWMAAFGPRIGGGAAASPAALFDPMTGDIDRGVARSYEAFDIARRVEQDPLARAVLRDRVRLVVGDEDNFYLNEAVALLKARLEGHADAPATDPASPAPEHAAWGSITIVPGADHGTVMASPARKAWDAEMAAYLHEAGLSFVARPDQAQDDASP